MAKRATRPSPKVIASRKKSTSKRSGLGRPATRTKAVSRPKAKAGVRATSKTKVAASRAKASSSKVTVAKKVARPKRPAAPLAKPATAVKPSQPSSRPKRAPRDPRPIVQSPPSSLDMNRRGTAARTGRAEIAESRADHATMTPSITGGDVDASVKDAYFTGDEAPGGDNTTPDQDVVDDIGKALGVEYQDNEELRGSDKVADRDKHRWELDPASAEDYRDRK